MGKIHAHRYLDRARKNEDRKRFLGEEEGKGYSLSHAPGGVKVPVEPLDEFNGEKIGVRLKKKTIYSYLWIVGKRAKADGGTRHPGLGYSVITAWLVGGR